jgi:hypothetical protein
MVTLASLPTKSFGPGGSPPGAIYNFKDKALKGYNFMAETTNYLLFCDRLHKKFSKIKLQW